MRRGDLIVIQNDSGMVCRMQKGEISFQTIFSYNIVLISSFKTEHRHLCLPPCQTEEDAQQVSRII